MDIVLEKLKQYKTPIILFVVMLVVLFIGMKVSGSQRDALTAIRNETAQLRSQQLVKDSKNEDSSSADGVVTVGLDENRIAADKEVIIEFLKKAFTFKNLDEYAKLREWMLSDIGLKQDCSFFRYYYPLVTNEADAVSKFNYKPIEGADYSVEYKDSTSYVVYIDNGLYTYVNHVQLKSGDTDYVIGIVCTVDGNGTITDVKGYNVKEASVSESDETKDEANDELKVDETVESETNTQSESDVEEDVENGVEEE